jgi:endonuclease-3
MNNIDIILDYLDELFPNPVCELNYNLDYELLIAVVLSAQTTDKKVNKVTNILFSKYPNLESLKDSDINELMEILKPLGMYQKKALFVKNIADKLLDKYDGKVINNREYLESLSGVGRKTTNVVLSVLFNEPLIAVDTHVLRVSKRLGLTNDKDNVLVVEKKLTKLINKERHSKSHYQLVLFGRYYCMALKPKCDSCKLKEICKYKKKLN